MVIKGTGVSSQGHTPENMPCRDAPCGSPSVHARSRDANSRENSGERRWGEEREERARRKFRAGYQQSCKGTERTKVTSSKHFLHLK